jgi:hypothetical protein
VCCVELWPWPRQRRPAFVHWVALYSSTLHAGRLTGGMGAVGLASNGSGPRIILAARSAGCMSPSIWWECHFPKRSAGVLEWTLHALRLLDRIRFSDRLVSQQVL